MFIDTTSKQNEYSYSIVQYANTLTGELFNLGLIMNYEDGHFIHLNNIKPNILNCIDVGELSSLNYTISLIHERLENGDMHIGSISNVIKISEPNIYTSSNDEKETFKHLVNELISIKRLRRLDQISKSIKYGKMQIISSLKSLNKNKNILFHQHIEGVSNIVDASYMKNGKPVVVAEITSPHTKNFYENIATSAFTLNEFNKIDTIQDKFIYAPILTSLSKNDDIKLSHAIETAREMGVDIVTRKNHYEVLERLGA